jgi:ketohexokinase
MQNNTIYDTVDGAERPYTFWSHIICVGAVYIDTILTYVRTLLSSLLRPSNSHPTSTSLTQYLTTSVPHFPTEDTKLRAQFLKKHRGGNTANSLEVLSQLISHDQNKKGITGLHLLAVLPAWTSAATEFVKDSLPDVIEDGYIYHSGYQEAASSYIIQSQETRSRTIVSINPLPDMQVQEFKKRVGVMVPDVRIAEDTVPYWIHFEGRVPEVLLECVKWLRKERPEVKISVECEKPERTGMTDVAQFADVVFYSRLWAEKNGFDSAKTFLDSQKPGTRDGAVLCCTWGSGGAMAVGKKEEEEDIWADVKAWQAAESEQMQVVDTIGAGDTFVAGMLFALTNHEEWELQRKLEFANQLAGKKVLQEGFDDLGSKMWEPDEEYEEI